MTSYVENETSITFDFDIKEVLDQVMEQVLAMEDCPYEAQVNLLITDDDGIRGFNREYRQIDAPTDVLSFRCFRLNRKGIFLRQRNRRRTVLTRKAANYCWAILLFQHLRCMNRR